MVFSIWCCIFSCKAASSSSERFCRHLISMTVNTISLFSVWKSTNKSSALSKESASISRNNSWCKSTGIIKESSNNPFFLNILFIRVVPRTSNALFLVLSNCIIILLETERMSASSSKNASLSLMSMPKFLKCGASKPSISEVGRQVRNEEMPFSSALGK